MSRCTRWCRRQLRRAFRALLILTVSYATLVLIGLIPVNNDFTPTPDGIEILVVSNAVHADLVLPIQSETIDWRNVFPSTSFNSNTSEATHISIGWGDKGFFIETPTWADLRAGVVANALLWPSSASIHVIMTNAHYVRSRARSVTISLDQYQQLVDQIRDSIVLDQNNASVQIPDAAYGLNDAFFEAHGSYHLLNTCNSWVGRGLKSAGIRTGWMTPMPKTVYWYFPIPEN